MRSRLVTRFSLLVLLALATGAAACALALWPDRRLEVALVFVPLAAGTVIFVRRLVQSLVGSVEQISQALTRLSKGEFDAPVPELGSIEEWYEPGPWDLVFANAVLQWSGDH